LERKLSIKNTLGGLISSLAWWALLFLFWLVITGSYVLPELLAGLAAALLCTLLVELSGISSLLRFKISRTWLHPVFQLPGQVIRDCWLLGVYLVKSIRRPSAAGGRFRAVSFQNGGNNPYGVTRRAFVTAVTSLSPNSYVIGIDEDENLLLLHEIVPTPEEIPE
jgi:multisubunit Na+/H+ antiporter MnhE subunit